jgi:hypothetical protein
VVGTRKTDVPPSFLLTRTRAEVLSFRTTPPYHLLRVADALTKATPGLVLVQVTDSSPPLTSLANSARSASAPPKGTGHLPGRIGRPADHARRSPELRANPKRSTISNDVAPPENNVEHTWTLETAPNGPVPDADRDWPAFCVKFRTADALRTGMDSNQGPDR